jgi:hypothetical protein
MISYFNLGENGRLGNQLFQYAALKSLGLKKNYEVKIPDLQTKQWHNQQCLLSNFNLDCGILNNSDLEKFQFEYDEPDPMEYDPGFFSIPDNTNLAGFFQSTYYFSEFKDIIKKELTPKNEFMHKAMDKMNAFRGDYDLVSVHLRRGDNTHNLGENQRVLRHTYGYDDVPGQNSFFFSYFNKAKDVYKNRKVKYLVFCGGSRNVCGTEQQDIDWCKKVFTGDEYLFSENHDSMLDFCCISLCDHHIVGHISSFGWWAAYINPQPNKIVVAPNKYHPDIPEFTHRKGFFPPEWLLI